MQWTRFQQAAVGFDSCGGHVALHRCHISQWLSPPPSSGSVVWTFVSCHHEEFAVHYYKWQTFGDAATPRVVYVGDILVLKVDSGDTVSDMSTSDFEWVKEHFQSML
jgi:hypothetical protein